jgi:hypothetical protein
MLDDNHSKQPSNNGQTNEHSKQRDDPVSQVPDRRIEACVRSFAKRADGAKWDWYPAPAWKGARQGDQPRPRDEPHRAAERRCFGAAAHHRVAENSAQPCAAPLNVCAPS